MDVVVQTAEYVWAFNGPALVATHDIISEILPGFERDDYGYKGSVQ